MGAFEDTSFDRHPPTRAECRCAKLALPLFLHKSATLDAMAEPSNAGSPPALALTAAELFIDVNGSKSVLRLEADTYRVGRSPSNQLSYPGAEGLSRQHLAIEREGSRWVARDLGSTNGSLVNGERIFGPRILRSGDRITAGEVNLLFRECAKPAASTIVFTDDEPPAAAGGITMSESLQGLIAEESEEGSRHMQALITAGRELATHLPLDKLFDLILDLSVKAAGAARGLLMTLENQELQVRSTRGQGLRISSHVRDMVIQERRSLLVDDAMMDSAFAAHASIVSNQIRSIMAVPLQTEERVIGLIYLDSAHFVKEFTKQDLSLLTVMANMAAVRIENARLAEVEQAERLRARELEDAAMIQRSILPSKFPPFPDRTDFELHAAMIPAKEVGGDLFDFFLLDPERLGFVVGDVSGKGVPAALFMAITRTLLRAAAHHEASPGACLTYMNQSLVDQRASEMFVTLFYGILNTRTGVLEYSNGGHNPPYVFSPDGNVRVLKESCGPMLGFFEGFQYPTRSTQVHDDEGVLVYTDGVTEACNKKGDFYEDSRLESYLRAHASQTADELVRGLHAEVERFEAGARRADDITVLAVRRRAPG
ncbi:MAG: SpoIIE family protein phosphatase [Acidobacteriaceae bacterium]|nr:SpoIIE family protein phosphatase [Acidobacteriaceae bacterium]